MEIQLLIVQLIHENIQEHFPYNVTSAQIITAVLRNEDFI